MLSVQFDIPNSEPTSLPALALNLALVLLFSQLLGWHFVRYAQVLSNKRKLARVLVFISTTTLLIITVVKTSLALSLGLVGALSIIRFRTPIKEPEELAYLFLAIAIGVGLGANRHLETTLVFLVVMVAMALRSHLPSGKSPLRTLLQVTSTEETDQAAALAKLMPCVTEQSTRCELRRVDCDKQEFHA
ncbi:MAG: putative membrane protein YhiD involved in acid resistance, partial [Planctomycetota bacterium]